ncbi:NAD(P)-dependent oxidoreductase [Croceibacterium aestuarii]|uniref:NAD(P)-dependent oxidoreductase n=1 Tax=Croceibacterium aestuarii TaxID=3064139 RepID=UPI0034E2CBAE
MALIGFGEAGSTFARAGGWSGRARGWDLLPERRALMAECGINAAGDPASALVDADIALCLVTADAALPAARDYAALVPEGTLWCDMNSVAPQTKRSAAEAIESAGGRYVDVAVMAPVDPAALDVPLLLAGPCAGDAEAALNALGFGKTRIVGDEVGRASAIKMIRSVMVKGLEALTSECAAAAEAAGVFDEVMASLDASEKATGWADKVAYNRERMDTHGLRRAAEMEEVCKTLAGLGVEPVMSEGAVALQRRAGENARTRKDQAA